MRFICFIVVEVIMFFVPIPRSVAKYLDIKVQDIIDLAELIYTESNGGWYVNWKNIGYWITNGTSS